jgi:drug/metabolite transporter (DMT)-like permease
VYTKAKQQQFNRHIPDLQASPKIFSNCKSPMTERHDDRSDVRERNLAIDVEEAKSLTIGSSDEKKPSPGKSKRMASEVVDVLRFFALLLCNTIAWYVTNGMNGIALQSFSSHVRDYRAEKEDLVSNIAVMLLVTGVQLAFGVVVGFVVLWAFSLMQPSANRGRRFQVSMARQEVILDSLHCIGSTCTNLGFSYGSASLIQILKLLEPFETLVLSRLLLPDESKITIGVVSSMIFVVGSAVSLIRIRPDKPHPHALLFAVLSGVTLSWRNVLQRKQHVQAQVDAQHEDYNKHVSKVERSVELFTKLSFHSAAMAFLVSFPLNGLLLATSTSHSNVLRMVLVEALNWRVLTWHPLYNTFSMITLGFCSALTHSLLNAGKRVFAIVMAIVWFREDFTLATLLGLIAVACGGCWYTLEAKVTKPLNPPTGFVRWVKLAISLGLLQALLGLQARKRE